MNKLSQKEAVYQAVVNVTGFKGEGAVAITKEQRAQVTNILFAGFKSQSIELDREYSDADLKGYCSGLQSNWLRKDVRLNGGTKYAAKNPGSRAGASDPQLKALKSLMMTEGLSEEDKAEIQVAIDTRTAEISKAKVQKTVDFSALPPEIAAKFNK